MRSRCSQTSSATTCCRPRWGSASVASWGSRSTPARVSGGRSSSTSKGTSHLARHGGPTRTRPRPIIGRRRSRRGAPCTLPWAPPTDRATRPPPAAPPRRTRPIWTAARMTRPSTTRGVTRTRRRMSPRGPPCTRRWARRWAARRPPPPPPPRPPHPRPPTSWRESISRRRRLIARTTIESPSDVDYRRARIRIRVHCL